ncbi:hypothetical protein PoB_003391100 [Plakobranchus ocellatus]|uniref:Uncharacterized protein n=1 Tax=Plakobranchus ocellatus TaxID=259542 RepID=A0AAV4A860_9GAST|nr:hypothetical protein PoB_003391100 [Plakobranchus ocellatus]
MTQPISTTHHFCAHDPTYIHITSLLRSSPSPHPQHITYALITQPTPTTHHFCAQHPIYIHKIHYLRSSTFYSKINFPRKTQCIFNFIILLVFTIPQKNK